MNKTRLDRIRDHSTASFGARTGAIVAAVLWPAYHLGRLLKTTAINLQLYYELVAAPFAAVRLPWLLWPVYMLCRAAGIRFVLNSSDGTGHIIAELDSYFRMSYLEETEELRRFVWIRKSSGFTRACVGLYRHKFWWATANTLLYDLFLPITIGRKDITVDVGLARVKRQLNDEGQYSPPDDRQTYLNIIPKRDGMAQWADYYGRRLNSRGHFPMSEADFDNSELVHFLNGGASKLALVHIKKDVVNATAKPTAPHTYLEAMSFLADLDYQLVFVGREEMPTEFRRFNTADYAGSPVASFKNDIQLFNMADVAIMSASGVALMAEVFREMPYLYLNSWHLGMPLFSRYCISVPALIQGQSGRLLTFAQQIELYESLPDPGPEIFPQGRYSARNATSEEILAGTREMVAMKEEYHERTGLQESFRQADGGRLLSQVESRCSEYFLQQHRDLL